MLVSEIKEQIEVVCIGASWWQVRTKDKKMAWFGDCLYEVIARANRYLGDVK